MFHVKNSLAPKETVHCTIYLSDSCYTQHVQESIFTSPSEEEQQGTGLKEERRSVQAHVR